MESPDKKNLIHGFSKGVNEYLNHFVMVSDAKAAVIIVLDFSILRLLIEDNFYPIKEVPVHWIGFILLLLSILLAALVLLPSLPRGKEGSIFWEDIRGKKSPERYAAEVVELDRQKIEEEYARQNFYSSKVLHRKMKYMQGAVWFFLLGLITTMVLVVW